MFAAAALLTVACDDDDNVIEDIFDNDDRAFMQDAARANRAEIDMSQLASTKSQNEAIQMYAMMMIEQHTEAQTELDSIANKENIDIIDELSDDDEELRDQLMALEGWQFDSAFMQSQVNAHQANISRFEKQVDEGEEDGALWYANKYLPILREHLEMADSINMDVMDDNDNND